MSPSPQVLRQGIQLSRHSAPAYFNLGWALEGPRYAAGQSEEERDSEI